jgi:hypothetical protein
MNKVDFFDSDGKDKSLTGTIFKIAAGIAPFLITKGGFNNFYGGLSAATGLMSVLPTFYKSIESILTGEDNLKDTSTLFKTATALEGMTNKFNNSVSDAGKESMFNVEQMGMMVGQVFGQIYQQRAAASLSKLFKSTNLSAIEAEEVAKFNLKYATNITQARKAGLIKDISDEQI